MTRAAIESQEDHNHLKVARDAIDREVLMRDADAHTANAVAKIRRDKEARNRRFAQWDRLVQSDEFEAYLVSRGYRLEAAYQPVPAADEAEFAAIGAMLVSSFAVKHGLAQLRPQHMRLTGNANVLFAIGSIRQRIRRKERISIDLVTVGDMMRRLGTWDNGTRPYLEFCIESCPSPINIRAYVKTIIEASQLRHQWGLGLQLASAARAETGGRFAPYANPRHLTNATRTALDKIEVNGHVDLSSVFENHK